MKRNKKSTIKKIPVFIVVTFLVVSGALKINGLHPMLAHFKEMGFSSLFIELLGVCEILFSLLFVLNRTSLIGLLLLTGYFGGAMAAEIPFHQVAAPLMPLVLVWVTAFVRQPSIFSAVNSSTSMANLSTSPK
jgi:hypothetical protein